MKATWLLFTICVLSAALDAATTTSIPAGTVVPVTLSSPLDASHSRPGQTVQAKVVQDVPLYNGSKIQAGSTVVGEILSAAPAQNSQPASIVFRFDRIVSRKGKQVVPLSAHLRALASPEEVRQAECPTNEAEVEKQHFNLTTVQIGGNDVVYRGGGPVSDGQENVGIPIEGGAASLGVLSHVSAYPGKPCRGPVAGNDTPQALWLFSHDACGVYGYDFTIVRTPQNDREGKIVLESGRGNLKLARGSALLLRVDADGAGGNLSRR